MAGQMDSEFRTVAITETSRNLQYNFLSSPVPFECPDTILSPALSSSTPHTVRLEASSRVFTPIPFQPRVSTPYPVVDSVASGKDWPGLSPENRLFPSSWGSESTVHIGQQFQGSMLPVATSTSHTVHHYAFPQSWHHAVTSPQNFSAHNFHSNDSWYPGDSSLIEGFGNVEDGNDIEQDSKVTSSTELASLWRPELVLPPVAELLNTSHGNIKCERLSPMEASFADNKYLQAANMQPSATCVKPKQEAKTQTPWKVNKPKAASVVQSQNKRKAKPRKRVNPLVYSQQKLVQRQREKAIREKITYLSTILPWGNLKNNRPSRNEILESAIRRILQLQEDIREAYLQKGLKTEDLKAALQGNVMVDLNSSCNGKTDEEQDLALISDDSVPSTPELVVNENLPDTPSSPITELSSQGSEEPERAAAPSSKPEENRDKPKRPMNAFLVFSKKHRQFFKHLYPGRDNRKISSLLAEQWRRMKPEEQEPYKRESQELMRQTKQNYPDFKYCDGIKKTGTVTASSDGNKQASMDQGYRVGSHILRQRGALHTSSKSLKPATKKMKCQQANKPDIKANSVPGSANDVTIFAAKNISPGVSLSQSSSCSLVKQILQSSNPSQGDTSVAANIGWRPSSCDMWVQCENCKKWHMLPDERDPASLPDKWYCCVNTGVR